MKYQSAQNLLPKALLEEIQKYVEGDIIYIPVKQSSRKKWGTQTGIRKELYRRNKKIQMEYQQGKAIAQLAEEYHLSQNTIRNIIYRA